MPTRQPILKTNDEDIEDYTKAIQTCLEVLADPKTNPKKWAKTMSKILAGTMIGIARQVVCNKNLHVSLEDSE